jgi:coenzyme F420 biosynthesis associated uncharacterized protein
MSPGPVDWRLAQRTAVRFAGREPLEASYHYDRLVADFQEVTAEAEELVAQTTGLRSSSGPARARVVDRAGWIEANISSFQRLLRPVTDKFAEERGEATGLSALPAVVGRRAAGVEVGVVLGWIAGRVLGQYDLLIAEDDDPGGQDMVYYVGPNVLALEKRFAFPPQEFRLWLALHEVTHRAQFTGIDWLRGHFLTLVHRSLDAVEPDPKRFLDAAGRAAEKVRSGGSPFDDGLPSLLAGPEQRDVLERIGGMMSLLEGHGDVTMNRAGADRIPSAERFARAMRQRRQEAGGFGVLAQRLLGFEAKLRQYRQGELFIEYVENHGGPGALEKAWRGPEWLPTLAEIRTPQEWLDRVQLSEEAGSAALE